MERTIEFRVWNGMEMVYDVMVGKFGIFYVNPENNGIDTNDSASLSPYNTKYPDDIPLMQYTGLKDKNGVKIYEGDIVVCLHAGQSIRGAIINKDACYFIQFTNGQMAWIGEAVKKYKVQMLGNIYDNPEMLEL